MNADRSLMKAATYRRYGPPDVVQIVDVPRPAHAYVDMGHKKGNVVITLE